MRKIAIVQTRGKLALVQAAVEALDKPASERAAYQSWIDFLHAVTQFYSKLEQGAKSSAKSIGWFGQKKHERRTDNLLKYLLHARNADEHGLDPLMQLTAPILRMEPEGYNVPSDRIGKELAIRGLPGRTLVTTLPTSTQLVDVKDRSGHIIPWPTNHKGQVFEINTVPAIARLALETLQGILQEAEKLAGID